MEQIYQEKIINIPNALTVSRIILIPAAVCFYVKGYENTALIVYLLAMLTDALDGMIARRRKQITTLGKVLDPLADKLSLLTMMSLFFAEGEIPLWMFALLIVKEISLIVGGAAAMRHGVIIQALPIGKAATAVFTVSITARFAGAASLADTAMYLAVIVSLASMLWYTCVLVGRMRHSNTLRSHVAN